MNNTEFSTSCSSASTATIDIAINTALGDKWTATGFVNISSSPPREHILDLKSVVLGSFLGFDGLLFSTFIYLAIVAAGLSNPVTGIVAGSMYFIFAAIVGITPFTYVVVISLALMTLIVSLVMRT